MADIHNYDLLHNHKERQNITLFAGKWVELKIMSGK